MRKRSCITFLLFSLFSLQNIQAQKDSLSDNAIYDSSIDYDVLFSELDAFLDSLLAPRSFTLINFSANSNDFVYRKGNKAVSKRQLTVTPSLGYFNKSGLGISGTATVIKDSEKVLPYQFSLTGSYDYLKNFDFATGVAATHIFTKDNLNFYTSPFENEVYTYFAYRAFWLKPAIAARYGWGSRTSYTKRKYIYDVFMPLPPPSNGQGNNNASIEESIDDLTLSFSVRHDFYWLDIFSDKSYIRLSPQLSLTGGTQNFGFNQTGNAYGLQQVLKNNVLLPAGGVHINQKTKFAPLSATATVRAEVNVGKFFLQPQVLFDYYLPEDDQQLSTLFNVNTGFIF